MLIWHMCFSVVQLMPEDPTSATGTIGAGNIDVSHAKPGGRVTVKSQIGGRYCHGQPQPAVAGHVDDLGSRVRHLPSDLFLVNG